MRPDYGNERVAAARAAVDAAVREWTAAVAALDPDDEHQGIAIGEPFVTGWVVAVDWTSVGLEATDASAYNVIAAEGQRRSTSLGLAHLAVGAFE